MNSQGHIQFYNFDSAMAAEPEHNIDCDAIGGDINNFLMNRFESEFEIHCESYLSYSKSHAASVGESEETKAEKPVEIKSKCEATGQTDPQTKQFQCLHKDCEKRFKFKWILDRHYLSHKPNKLFKCSYKDCIKSYKSKENLTLHVKNIHLKLKPYSCRYCPSLFSHRNGKTYHERKFHTLYLPHKCPLPECGLNFASKSALTYHSKSQHNQSTCQKSASKNKKNIFNQEILKLVNDDSFSTNNNSPCDGGIYTYDNYPVRVGNDHVDN